MKKFGLLFFTVFSLMFFAQFQNNEKILEEAYSHYNESDYGKAIPLFEKYLKVHEKDYEVLQSAGISYFRVDQFQKAKEKFRLAALYCPVDQKTLLASYYSNLSGAYSNLADNAKAYEYAVKAYRTEETTSTLFNAASMANNMDKCAEALKLLNESTLDKDNNFNSLFGVCHYKQKDYEAAVRFYENFFANYQEEESIKFNMEDERSNLLYAYLSEAAVGQTPTNQERLSNIKKTYLELVKNEQKKEQLLNRFSEDVSTWNLNQNSADIINQLVQITPKPISAVSRLKIMMAQKNFAKMEEVANGYLRDNSERDAETLYPIKYFRYVGNLASFTTDLKAAHLRSNEKKLSSLIQNFRSLYEDKEYSKDEITSETMLPVQITFEFFQDAAKSVDEQKKVAPILMEILKHFPNAEVRTKIQEILLKGTLKN